ncbi:MAG: DUF6298 domain-containing protein [Limisphaerales bacterium]
MSTFLAIGYRLSAMRRTASLVASVVSASCAFSQTAPLDFSTAGYAAQARPIPNAPVRIVVAAQPGDSTARIQRALDHVGALPPDTNGLRGAVLLLAGRHEVFGGLRITNSGVVLRGQGISNTVLFAAGQDRRTLIRVVGGTNTVAGERIAITDAHVPVGAARLHIADPRAIRPLSLIRLTRPSTTNWIARLRATDFGGGVGGGWKPGSRDITWDRIVTAIEGNRITLDAPLTTALEEPGAYLVPIHQTGQITNVGVENLTLESAFDPDNPKDENHSWCAITMERTADAWVRQVVFRHFAASAVALYETCRRITVQDCVSLAPISEIGGYRRHTFFTMGQQTLFLRCYAEHGRHDFSVGHCAAGPNAFVQCEAREPLADSGPIESWASGVLYDNVNIDGNALTLGYRAGNNAGIGWAAANCVLWNCSASVIRCWNPPGATNWSFGSWAGFEGDGEWRSSNDFMKPDSLFAAQLKERLGEAAAARLQLMPRPREESSNPTLDKARELAAAAHQPPPQLRDYILAANQREPIPSETNGAIRLDALPPIQAPTFHVARSALRVTNGWLTVNGRLLIGGTAGVTWWRGSIRPGEAANFGLNLTRFVPGRIGAGFTDDLNEVADRLLVEGRTALDHNYGLWYDRRRDDHQRVRRMDGNVLPPFYEQPFARSGQGTAWDGLSQYDLTKFNPWYWSRLREFADIADERGLVLFHQHYFQHNILEAGAHWADFPWRSANNINLTGFPEPPPYAGDKRIFMAELFYDVAPEPRADLRVRDWRQRLHKGYLRQCLDNFTNNVNVIHFTSAEYTGPLHFMQFWLDTIAAWQKGQPLTRPSDTLAPSDGERAGVRGSPPLIALSCTKDVQDAILADPKRSAVVDVIDFRYWWRTDQGEFAPPGGKNLAPRQFERQWRGGRPNDANLADMAAEYRARFPAKPLICDFDAAGWAWVCAGGSLPRLPRTTDTNLLAAIPRMQPWLEASGKGRWVLREPGRQYLVYGGGQLDWTGETGEFRTHVVNPATGEVSRGGTVPAGRRAQLPDTAVVWLIKE